MVIYTEPFLGNTPSLGFSVIEAKVKGLVVTDSKVPFKYLH